VMGIDDTAADCMAVLSNADVLYFCGERRDDRANKNDSEGTRAGLDHRSCLQRLVQSCTTSTGKW
jgi:hypothetical protein